MNTIEKFRSALHSSEIDYATRIALTAIGERIRSGAGFDKVGIGAEILTADEYAARLRTTVTGSDGSGVPVPAWQEDSVIAPQRGGRIASLCRIIPNVNPQVAVGIEGARMEVAAPTPYGTTAIESSVDFVQEEIATRRFAAFTTAHRSVLEDSTVLDQAVRVLLDGDVARSLDDQVLQGDATGENFEGVLVNSDVPTITAAGTPTDALADAAGEVRDGDYLGSIAAVLSATDAASLVKDGASQNDELAILRAVLGVESIVVSSIVPEGFAVIGDWNAAATIYVRQAPGITVSDSHASTFTESKLTLLAEMRASFKVAQPSALRIVEF